VMVVSFLATNDFEPHALLMGQIFRFSCIDWELLVQVQELLDAGAHLLSLQQSVYGIHYTSPTVKLSGGVTI
jgi:hypothetical protein